MVKKHWSPGWWLLAAVFVIAAVGAAGEGFLVKLIPGIFREYFSSSAVELGTARSLFFISGGIALFAIGPLIDRYGYRKLTLIGIPMAGTGFILLSFVSSILAFNVVITVLLGIGISAGFLLPAQTALVKWFAGRRALALAILMTAPELVKAAVDLTGDAVGSDWRTMFLWLGIGILALGIPLALMIKNRTAYPPLSDDNSNPGDVADPNDVDFTLGQALKTRSFWLLAVAPAVSVAGISMVTINQYFILEQSFTRVVFENILQISPLASVVGILVFGYLGDILPKRFLLAGLVLVQGLSTIILIGAENTTQLYLYAFVFGFGSGTVPLLLAIRADYFGRKAFATITVAMMVANGIFTSLGAFSVFLAGLIYDATGSFEHLWVSAMALAIISAVVFLLIKPPLLPGDTIPTG